MHSAVITLPIIQSFSKWHTSVSFAGFALLIAFYIVIQEENNATYW